MGAFSVSVDSKGLSFSSLAFDSLAGVIRLRVVFAGDVGSWVWRQGPKGSGLEETAEQQSGGRTEDV